MKNRHCLLCKRPRNTLYWHINDDGNIWCYCCSCGRSYNIYEYCGLAGISLKELVSSNLTFEDRKNDEVNRLPWPSTFVSLLNEKAKEGADYIKSRGIKIEGDMYYDVHYKAIAFPLYYHKDFCGAQLRLINPITKNGSNIKMMSMVGTRTSILIYNWNQQPFMTDVKNIIITEGAFNCLSIQQSLNYIYKNTYTNPYRCVAMSGSAGSSHHIESMKCLVKSGYKVILAPDRDAAGLKMLIKFRDGEAITHYCLPDDKDGDWNDVLKNKGEKGLLEYFFKRISKIN